MRTLLLLVFCFATTVLLAQDKPASLIRNGGFEQHGGWSTGGAIKMAPSDRGGRCLYSEGGTAMQDVLVGKTNKTYTIAVDVKCADVKAPGPPGYGYVAVYQLDSQGQYHPFFDFAQFTGTKDWQRYTYTFKLDPVCETISVRFGIFQATGKLWCDNWTLVEGDRAYAYDEVAEGGRQARTGAGSVAIFRQEGFPAQGQASSPEVLAGALSAAGLKPQFLNAGELADATKLRIENYDLLVLPYGASFPAEARETVITFLHNGGHFISTGGYIFNNLLLSDGKGYRPEKDVLQERLKAALTQENSLIINGSFEQPDEMPVGGETLDGKWHVWSRDNLGVVEAQCPDGKKCAQVSISETGPTGEAGYYLSVPATVGQMYRVTGWVKSQNITGEGFAYLALYQYGEGDKLLHNVDYAQVRGTNDWKQYSFDFAPDGAVKRIFVKFGLYRAKGTAWFDDFRLANIQGTAPKTMNSSTGGPGDGLELAQYQIGAFDADFRLKRVASAMTAPGQHILPAGLKVGPATGWAAAGKQGNDDARWIPLLASYDKYGRPRGSAGSLMINYNGYYAGSMWAYFGVENQDLFAAGNKPMLAAFGELARFMLRGVFLRNLATDMPAYEPGETVTLKVTADNRGMKAQAGVVRLEVFREGSDKPLFTHDQPVSCSDGDQQEATASFKLSADSGDLCRVKATLLIASKPVDEVTRGFVVKSKPVLAAGNAMLWRDNYFTIGGRPMFLFGSDTYGNSFSSATENPLTWSQDHLAARDMGLNVYENLGSGWADYKPAASDWRAFEGMAQLTQKHNLQFMPGLLIGQNVAISAEQTATESAMCAEFARKIGDTPGLIWYINGDYQLKDWNPSDSEKQVLKTRWNAFLTAQYGTTDKLKAAWGATNVPAELGQLDFPPANSGRWDDRRKIDRQRFNVWMMRTWNESHVKALRSVDQTHAITSEYYQMPFNGMDLLLSIDGQDVSNVGYFDVPKTDIEALPWKIRWNDLRVRGKGVNLGEYGVKTHPGWRLDNNAGGYHIQRTEEQQKQLFMAVAHYGLGMGASKVQNWCLRDASEWVFPWGYFYPNQLIPKDVAYVHRNQSLIWRHFQPKYVAPALTVLIPDNLRMGNMEDVGCQAGYRTFAALLGLHYDFNVLNDTNIKDLPATTKVLVYPAATCPSDATYQSVLDFVKRGGKLILTGDISYDENRQRNRTERLKELCGLDFVAEKYPNIARVGQPGKPAPCIQVKPAGATVRRSADDGTPLLTEYKVGEGTVYYCTDAFVGVDKADVQLQTLYKSVLSNTGLQPLSLTPDDPAVNVFAQRTKRGTVHVLYNTTDAPGAKDLTLKTAAGPVGLRVRNGWPGLAAVTNDGKLIALTCDGRAGSTLTGKGFIGALSLDGETLLKSGAVLLAPFETGEASMNSMRKWKTAEVLVGDVQDGVWRTYERLPATFPLKVKLDADRASCLVLVCEKADEAKWTRYLGEAFTHPEKVEGM